MEYTVKENQLDYDTYFALRESVGWNNFSKEQAQKAISNSFYSVTIEHACEIIGMGRVVGDGMYFTVVDIVVAPEFQGKGIGTTIIQTILQAIENSMCEKSRGSVQLLSEPGKEEFYIKQGFKLVPHEYCGPALRKIIRR